MNKPNGAVPLTNTLVESLSPATKPYDVRDSRATGFFVRVEVSGSKIFRCQYRRGKTFTIGRFGTITVSQARQIAQKVIGDAAAGIDPNQKKKAQRKAEDAQSKEMNCSQFLEQIYAPWYRDTFPKSEKNTLRILRNEFMPKFGKMLLAEISVEKVENWRNEQKQNRKITRVKENENGETIKYEKPVGPATLNRYIQGLTALLSKAVEYGRLERNPLIGIKKLKEPEHPRVRFLSPEEYVTLIKALEDRQQKIVEKRASGNQWRKMRHQPLLPDLKDCKYVDHLMPMCLISLGSGMRFNSLTPLRWEHNVDISNPETVIINLNPEIVKNAKGNVIPLDTETSKVVVDWYEQTYPTHKGKGWVFPGKKPGSHITSVKRSWNNLLKAAGIKDFHWHDQRHDYASQHVMAGTDVYTLMKLLGHSSPKITMRYAHVGSQHKVEAANRLKKRRAKIYKKGSGK